LEDIGALNTLIQNYLIDTKTVAKVSIFHNPEDVIIVPNRYDVYFLDMDSEKSAIDLGKKMREIDRGSEFVYMSANPNVAHIAAKARSNYFITKPFDKEDIDEILTEIKSEIRQDSIIIKIPSGDRRVRLNNLNYINIVRRCLCYHLKDGTMFDG
jgi:DNA-binding LytR/AlgR family response regulator